jgi:hypothetical protein
MQRWIGVTNDSRAVVPGVFGPRREVLLDENIPFIIRTAMT